MHWWDFWMHKIFWIRWLPVIVTFVLLILGTAFFTARRRLTVAYFQVFAFHYLVRTNLQHSLVRNAADTCFHLSSCSKKSYSVSEARDEM